MEFRLGGGAQLQRTGPTPPSLPTLKTYSRDFTPFLFSCHLLTICSSNLYIERYLNKHFIKKNTHLYINYKCNMFSYFICQSKGIAGECLLKKDAAVSMPFFSKGVADEFDASRFCLQSCT